MKETELKKMERKGQGEPAEGNPEVIPGPRYRKFSREYKLGILAEAAQCERGELGALLRREGLYHSTLGKWRQQQAAGQLEKATAKEGQEASLKEEVARLKQEKARLEAKLARAEAVIAVQKKLSEVLGIPLEDDSDANEND